MSITLASMVGRLESDVPAQNSFPSDEQYGDAVKDAVREFSRRVGMMRRYDLPVVNGTADYVLSSDFVKLIRLESIAESAYQGVIVTGGGLIPVSNTFNEHVVVNGQTLTIYPTPQYTMTRYLWYKGGHVLDSSDTYAYMTDEMADVVHLKAQGIVWRLIAGQVGAKKAWKYKVGDVEIDKTKLADALKGWIGDFDRNFERRVEKMIGTVGSSQ